MPNAFFERIIENYQNRNEVVLTFGESAAFTGPEFLSLVSQSAEMLLEAGLNAGDRIALEAGPNPTYIASVIGAIAAGAIVVPINPSATHPEVDYVFGDATPKFAIGNGEVFQSVASGRSYAAKTYQGVGSDLAVPSNCTLLSFEIAGVSSINSIENLCEIDSPCLIGYTSGTTGKPKGALLSLNNLYASAKGLIKAWKWSNTDHLLHFLPLYHMHGLGVGVFASLVADSKITFLERFTEDLLFQSVEQKDISMIFGVPTIYERISRDDRLPSLAKLRLMVSGSAPLPTDLFDRIKDTLSEGPVERYGMTETVMNTSNPFAGERRAGKVGMALEGVSVKIAPDGEVLIKGGNVMLGYLGRPAANDEAFTSDGYFRTGDQGEVDEDGYLEIKGRKKDLIISGGFNVYPKEVEAEIRAYRGIREAAVVGRPSELWGEEVVAFVECSDSIDAVELIDFLRTRLSSYKLPKEVFIVETLPRNNLGKILYSKIREEYLN